MFASLSVNSSRSVPITSLGLPRRLTRLAEAVPAEEEIADNPVYLALNLARVLVNDSGSGVMRHADAGYESAIETAKRNGLNLPMIK